MSRPYTREDAADCARDAVALIGAQARKDEEACQAILGHGDPVRIAMLLAEVLVGLLERDDQDPAQWAEQNAAALTWPDQPPAPED
jgi:hypothetical protein